MPLTPARWPLFEELFGERGACGGCWCMAWRVRARDWARRQGAPNKRAMRRLVTNGPPPGVLAVLDDTAIGWCAVAPRSAYVRLETSRAMRPVDDVPVWSISCLFVRRDHRRQGLSSVLLREAARFAHSRGARVVEGYPVAASDRRLPDVFAWTGTLRAFERAGFREVHRWLPNRPIMRLRFRETT